MPQPPTLAALAMALAVLPALGVRAAPATDRAACAAAPATAPERRPDVPPRGRTLTCAPAAEAGCPVPNTMSWRFRADGRPLPDWRAACVHRTDRDGRGGPAPV